MSLNFTRCHFDVKDPISGLSFTQYASKIDFSPSVSYFVFYGGPYFSETIKRKYPKTEGFLHCNYLPSSDFGLKLGLRLISIDLEYYWGLKDYGIWKATGRGADRHSARTRMLTIKFEW